MLQDEYLPAKLGFDTAEIEPSKHLQKFGNILQNKAYLPTRRAAPEKRRKSIIYKYKLYGAQG